MPVSAMVSRFFRKFSLLYGKQFAKLRLEGLEDRQVMDHSLFAVGSPAGEVSLVKIIDRNTGDLINEFQPYASSFKGGIHVTMADLTGDYQPDIIVSPASSGGPHVKVFDGKTGELISSFYAFDPSYSGGLNIAAGDIGNGSVGIVAARDGGAGPEVRVFSMKGGLIKSFNAYDPSFDGGVKVALGYAESGNAAIFTAAGMGGGPHIKTFEARSLKVLNSFYAYDSEFQGGVNITATDLTGDGVSEIVTGPGAGGGPHVKVFERAGSKVLASFMAGNSDAALSTLVSAADTADGARLSALVKKGGAEKLLTFQLSANGTVEELGSGANLAAAGLGSVADQAAVHRFNGNNESPNELATSYTGDAAAPASLSTPDMYSANPIRYNDGTPGLNIPLTDDSGVYGDVLDYTNKLDYSTGQHAGIGWLYSGTPSIVLDGRILRFVLSSSEVVSFNNPFWNKEVGIALVGFPLAGVADTMDADASAHTFTLVRADGSRYLFNTFHSSIAANKKGTLESITDPAGNVVYQVTSRDASSRVLTLEQSVDQSGTTVKTRRTLSYVSGGVNDGFISQIVYEKKVGAGSWATDRTTTLDYYSGTGDSGGTDNELKLVTIKDASNNVLSKAYFRYWATGQTNGYNQAVKYVLYGSNYDRMVQAGYTPTTATNGQLDGFANHYFEYDDQFRANKEIAGGDGASTNSYTTNPHGLSTNDFNYWNVKTVETLPDGNQNIVYTNFQKQVIISSFKNTATNDQWITYKKYSPVGNVAIEANPSAMTGYDDTYNDLVHYVSGNAAYISDSTGLVKTNTYAGMTTATTSSAGDATDWLKSVSLSQGETGTAITQAAVDYILRGSGGRDLFFVANSTQYRNTNGTGGQTTSYAYTWQGSTAQPDQITVTKPTVTAAQNGPNSADTEVTDFDSYGRPIWTKDGNGILTYIAYDVITGAVIKQIVDVDTTQTSTFASKPSGWSTPASGGAHLTTTYEVDNFGRTTKTTHPNGRIDYTVYNDANFEVRSYPAWDSTSNAPLLPITVMRNDKARGYTETLTMTATPVVSSGRPTGAESIASVQSLSRTAVNAFGQVVSSDTYFNLSGVTYSASTLALGTVGTNYYRTEYGYDSEGKLVRTLSPTGTIFRTVFDAQNRVISNWIGLDDTPTTGSWSPSNTTGTDLTKVSEVEYDGGGVGDGNVTKTTEIPGGGATDHVSQTWYDWRNRPVATKAGVEVSEATDVNRPIVYLDYDNLNEVTKTRRYDGDTVSITSTSGVPNAPSSSLLRAQTESLHDEQNRVFRTLIYSIDPSSGTISTDSLTSNTWYDHAGQVIKSSAPGGLVQKTIYDGIGRVTKQYTTDGGSDGGWSDADDVASDYVLEQVALTYDAGSHVILTTTKKHFHDDTGTAELGTVSTGNKARVSYLAAYYDGADRLVCSVDVGTNGGSPYTRPGSAPGRSDTILVTDYSYNLSGQLRDVIDPKGIVVRTTYDNIDRITKTVEDYTDGTISDTSNKTTEYSYNAAGRTSVKVNLPSSGLQVTNWVYGVTTSGGNALNSNDIIKEVCYPDPSTGASSSIEKDAITSNALGQKLTVTDRSGNVHTYTYDALGRQTADAVTTLGSGVDGAVRLITTAYDSQGNPYLFTSYDAVSGGSVVNQVRREFNGLGQITREWQEHNGAVSGSSSSVQYSYSEMASSANHSRLTGMTYASGYVVNYNYASGIDSNISRLTSISDSSDTLESLSYLGLGAVVKRAHSQSGVDLSYIKLTGESTGDAGDQYVGLDRFGRIVDQRWINGGNADVDRFKYGYDRNGNVLYKENIVNSDLSEVYAYDDLNQLASYKLGTLNGGKTDVTGSPTNAQSWDYDATGNWDSVTSNGVTQTRGANKQNEITSVSSATTPTYDNNGNLTKDENNYRFVWDAWNREVKIKNSSDTIITINSYDAVNRKVKIIANATTTDRFFSSNWQLLEEKVATGTKSRNVWSPVYIDAMIIRERDTDSNGSFDERLYALQDANFNVTAITNTSGSIQEKFTETPFGVTTFRNSLGTAIGNSARDWAYLHQGSQADIIGDLDFRNRILSPSLGRWLSNDPLGFDAGDTNLYRLIGNNPINNTDYSGLIVPDVIPTQQGNPALPMPGGPVVPPQQGKPQPPASPVKIIKNPAPPMLTFSNNGSASEEREEFLFLDEDLERLNVNTKNHTIESSSGPLVVKYMISWALKNASGLNGYVVQEVFRKESYTSLGANETPLKGGEVRYWEVWNVKNGFVGRIYQDDPEYKQDMFSAKMSEIGYRYDISMTGTARFYPQDPMIEAEINRWAPIRPSKWVNDMEYSSGNLRATETKPSFWGPPQAGDVKHTLNISVTRNNNGTQKYSKLNGQPFTTPPPF